MYVSSRTSYEGGKEKGLYEGYGKATYIGGHKYSVSENTLEDEDRVEVFMCVDRVIGVVG